MIDEKQFPLSMQSTSQIPLSYIPNYNYKWEHHSKFYIIKCRGQVTV